MTTLPDKITAYTPTSTGKIASKNQAELGATDFLRLMTEQMKQQDPFAPTDNAQMVAQMAQMSSSSGIAEMAVTLKNISTQITEQTKLLKTLSTPASA